MHRIDVNLMHLPAEEGEIITMHTQYLMPPSECKCALWPALPNHDGELLTGVTVFCGMDAPA